MKLKALPLAVALLPAAALHGCYLLAAHLGHVAWCVPYLPDCVSISATVRHAPETAIFRAALVPTAVLMALYWWLAAAWLGEIGAPRAGMMRAVKGLGLAAALGLLLYAALLGEPGPPYRGLRRLGMISLYVFTVLAQVSLTIAVAPLAKAPGGAVSPPTYRALAAISGGVLLAAAASGLAWAFYDGFHRFEDAVEWGLTMALLAHTVVVYFAWRETAFEARFTVSGRRSLRRRRGLGRDRGAR